MNLDKTAVRAPADGYVTNLALRKGARVTAQSPVMAFIDTSQTIFAVAIPQINTRYIETGQPIEVTFKALPGAVYTGRVETILQAIATGQTQTSGLAVAPTDVETAPFIVRVKLDDDASDFASCPRKRNAPLAGSITLSAGQYLPRPP